MTFHRLLPIASVALMAALLSACQTMSAQERRAADENTCAGYGFRRGSEAMARCLLELELDRRAETRAVHARLDSMMWPPLVVERRVIVERR